MYGGPTYGAPDQGTYGGSPAGYGGAPAYEEAWPGGQPTYGTPAAAAATGMCYNHPVSMAKFLCQACGAALERLAGTYAFSGRTMKIWVEGDKLQAQLAGQEPVTLVPNSATSFDVAETGATLTFPAGDGPAEQAAIRQGGREMVLKRAE